MAVVLVEVVEFVVVVVEFVVRVVVAVVPDARAGSDEAVRVTTNEE